MEIFKHIAVGLLFILVGLWFVITSYKDKKELDKVEALKYVYLRGYIAGAAFILGGILEIFGYWDS